jgi:hypothetical protein
MMASSPKSEPSKKTEAKVTTHLSPGARNWLNIVLLHSIGKIIMYPHVFKWQGRRFYFLMEGGF